MVVIRRVIYLTNNPEEVAELEKKIKEATPAAPSQALPKIVKQAEIEKHKLLFAQAWFLGHK